MSTLSWPFVGASLLFRATAAIVPAAHHASSTAVTPPSYGLRVHVGERYKDVVEESIDRVGAFKRYAK